MRTPLWELSTAHDCDERQHNHSTGNVRNNSVLTIAIAWIFFSLSLGPRVWMWILDDVLPMYRDDIVAGSLHSTFQHSPSSYY